MSRCVQPSAINFQSALDTNDFIEGQSGAWSRHVAQNIFISKQEKYFNLHEYTYYSNMNFIYQCINIVTSQNRL